MGLLDIFTNNKKKEENLFNGWFSQYRFDRFSGKYSDVYLQTIINKIFFGLSNVRFINTGKSSEVDELAKFLTNNIKDITYLGWRDGYVVIDVTTGDYSLVYDSFRFDKYGNVVVPAGKDWRIFYTDVYKMKRCSDFCVIKENLCFIDRLANSLDYLTSTYGSVGIISGKTMPMNVQDKEELNKQLQENLGITRNKNQFIISRGTDFDIKQFSFDMTGLDLEGKLKMEYFLLADYFNVPKNILTSDTDSTYENQNAALKRFYTDCITPLVEKILDIGRKIIVENASLIPEDDLTFSFDNVECINQDSSTIEFLEKLTGIIRDTDNENIKSLLTNKLIDKITNWQ